MVRLGVEAFGRGSLYGWPMRFEKALIQCDKLAKLKIKLQNSRENHMDA